MVVDINSIHKLLKMAIGRFLQIFDSVDVNVYDVNTKQIVFSGGQKKAANFLGVPRSRIASCLYRKDRIKDQFAIRIKSTKVVTN